MQIRQRETLNHQGAITHEVCCLAAQLPAKILTQTRMEGRGKVTIGISILILCIYLVWVNDNMI